MQNFLIVAQQVGILFALISIGAICRWTKLIGPFSVRGIVNVLIWLVTPCLIIDVFQRPFNSAALTQLALAFLIVIALHLTLIALTYLTVRTKDERTAPVLRLSIVFSNAGFMGIPLEQAVFGDEGVFFGIVYVATFNLVIWSWGLMTARGKSAAPHAFTQAFINPGTIGLALGLAFFLASLRLPAVLSTPVHMLSELNTPLAMLVIGYYLAGAHLKALATNHAAHLAAALRLLLAPLLLTAALFPFRAFLNHTMMLSLVTAASAPVAAMVTMFAAKFNRDVDLSVGMVSGTTLASIFTMPIVIAFAMSILN